MRPYLFPPLPRGMKGRSAELRFLSNTVRATAPTRLALVGPGGSGKSMLACALGHRLKREFKEGIHWFRVGAWDFRTLTEMMALRFGTRPGDARVRALKTFLRNGERLIVLDNHEDDRTMAELLDAFSGASATFVITARRCLLAGVLIYPVMAPLVTSGESAFPRVAQLTRILRWNPLALDIADSIVASHAAKVDELGKFLREKRADRVRAIAHEDDLPEVALLVAWAWQRLARQSRQMLTVLAHVEGDHVDFESLAKLARPQKSAARALEALARWHLVQEPMPGRYALHAVVRHAVVGRRMLPQRRVFEHYVSLLERLPERLLLEQTHLFAAMDHAHRTNDLSAMLRVEALLRRLEGND